MIGNRFDDGMAHDLSDETAYHLGGLVEDMGRADGGGGEVRRARPGAGLPGLGGATDAADRFEQEQMFEEDVRAVLSIMRPNRYERLLGWNEYRTGGAHFRATISWDPAFEQPSPATTASEQQLSIPHLTDVLETILVGSVKNQDELPAQEEFEIYRGVVRELYRRLDEMQSCYE